jgi:PhzF family phenazine biosynthesis protein
MKLYQVDAFTDQPFRGNPAAVCVLDGPRPDAWMQALAAEMNLSETAFPLPQGDGFGLRWLTPKQEVGLCGHATLATAHILWAEGYLRPDQEARFETKSGLLTASKRADGIEMNFPARFVTDTQANALLNRALGAVPRHTSVLSSAKGNTYLLEYESERQVAEMVPDFAALLATDARAVIVTSRAETPGYDFVSRFFAPALGISEDPVTGSAHCYLAPYWSKKLGKVEMVGWQVSARTGVVGCAWQGERVALRGQAVTVFKAELLPAG